LLGAAFRLFHLGLQFGPALGSGGFDLRLGLVHLVGELAEILIGRHVITFLEESLRLIHAIL
jgi:hypothetical protein